MFSSLKTVLYAKEQRNTERITWNKKQEPVQSGKKKKKTNVFRLERN